MEPKAVIAYVRRGIIVSTRASFRAAHDHPVVFILLFFMILLHSFLPNLFAFLVSSSPVIICTALLLGMLLSYGEPNIPEIEEEFKRTHDISALKSTTAMQELLVKQEESSTLDTQLKSWKEVEGIADGVSSSEEIDTDQSQEEEDEITSKSEKSDEEAEHHNSSYAEGNNAIHVEGSATEEEEVHGSMLVKREGTSDEIKAEGVLVVDEDIVDVYPKDLSEPLLFNYKIDTPLCDNIYDAPLGHWQPVDHHIASSDSESEGAESSSSDASMADILPMLDELHPLLNSQSRDLVPDNVIDEGSEYQIGNQEDEEEEDDGHEEKDAGAEVAVKWTADDQKNLMDLGTSELERNERLESLIAKRRARKNTNIGTEKNLIDLDGADTVPIMEHLSHLLVQIPPITATRRNPFDLPFDTYEGSKLPPIPGSAPSVFHRRRNPFDFSYDELNEKGISSIVDSSGEEVVAPPRREVFFQRNESFSVGSSTSAELNKRRHSSRLKPYFVSEKMDTEETGFIIYQRQSSEMSDSKVSSLPETDSASAFTDHGDHKEVVEHELPPLGEVSSLIDRVTEPITLESHFSHEVLLINPGEEPYRGDSEHVEAGYLVTEESHQDNASLVARGQIIGLMSPTIVAANLDMLDENDDVIPSLLDTYIQTPPVSMHEQEGEAEQSRDGQLKYPTPADLEDLYLLQAAFGRNSSQTGGPVYDLSPSSSSVAFLDSILQGEEEPSSSFLESNTHTEASETASTSAVGERKLKNVELFFVAGAGETLAATNAGVTTSKTCHENNTSRVTELSDRKQDGVTAIQVLNVGKDVDRHGVQGSIHSSISLIDNPIKDYPVGIQLIDQPVADEDATSCYLNDDFAVGTTSTGINLTPSVLMETSYIMELGLNTGEDIENELASSRAGAINEFGEERTADSMEKSSDSKEESGKILSEVQEIKEIDEGLLQELDAVGDFQVHELKLEQARSYEDLLSIWQPGEALQSSSMPAEQLGSGDETLEDVSALALSSEASNIPDDVKTHTERQTFFTSEVASSLFLNTERTELTVYNSKLHVLNACTSEEIDSVPKKLPADLSKPFASEIEAYPMRAKPVVPSSEFYDRKLVVELTKVNSDLVVLEAKPVADIKSAFKQLGQHCGIDSSQSEAVLSEISPMDTIGFFSDLQVTEIESSMDMNSTSQLPDETHECPPAFEFIEHEVSVEYSPNGSLVGQAHSQKLISDKSCKDDVGLTSEDSQSAKLEISERHVQPDEARKAEVVIDNTSGIVILEAKSIDDINAAFKQVCEGCIETGVAEVGSSNIIVDEEPGEAQWEKISDGLQGQEELNHVTHQNEEREGCQHSEVLEDSEGARTNIGNLVVDARSIEDISLALNQHEQGGSERSVVLESGPSNITHDTVDTGDLVVQLDLQFVEEKANLAIEAFAEKSSQVELLDNISSFDASTFT